MGWSRVLDVAFVDSSDTAKRIVSGKKGFKRGKKSEIREKGDNKTLGGRISEPKRKAVVKKRLLSAHPEQGVWALTQSTLDSRPRLSRPSRLENGKAPSRIVSGDGGSSPL